MLNKSNTKEMKTRVMRLAWEIKRNNKKEFFGNWNKNSTLLTWSECLKLAWKLLKSWSGKIGEIVSESIEIFRPNGANLLRRKGAYGIRYTIK